MKSWVLLLRIVTQRRLRTLKGEVLRPGVTSAGVVAHAAWEDISPAGELVGKDFLLFEYLSFPDSIKRLCQRVVRTGASHAYRLGDVEPAADGLKLL